MPKNRARCKIMMEKVLADALYLFDGSGLKAQAAAPRISRSDYE
jgi:hypothetical protein